MPMFKIYIGNLDKRTSAEQLRMLFTGFADLDDLVVATDETGKSRGFAIAMFKDATRGQLAIETLKNRRVNGRPLVVNEALKKGQAPPPLPDRGPIGPRGGRAAGGGGGFSRGGGGGGGFSRGGSGGGGGRPLRNPRRSSFGGPAGSDAPSAPGAAPQSGAPDPARPAVPRFQARPGSFGSRLPYGSGGAAGGRPGSRLPRRPDSSSGSGEGR